MTPEGGLKSNLSYDKLNFKEWLNSWRNFFFFGGGGGGGGGTTANFLTNTFESYFCLKYLQWLLRSLKMSKDFIWSTRLICKFSDSIDRSFTGSQGGDIISTPNNFSIYFLAIPFFSFLKAVFFECLYHSWFYLVKLSLLRLKPLPAA